MSIQCKQHADYKGEGLWEWAVWIDGTENELDQIDYVKYTLHPTFPNPVQRKRNRSKKFRLSAAGWGEFTIYVMAKFKDGQEQELKHALTLSYPDATPASIKVSQDIPFVNQEILSKKTFAKLRTLYLSSGSADASFSKALRKALIYHDLKVITSNDIGADLPLDEMMKMVAQKADLALVILSDQTSTQVVREVETLDIFGLKLIPLLVGTDPKVPPLLKEVFAIHIADLSDPEVAAEEAAEQILKIRPT